MLRSIAGAALVVAVAACGGGEAVPTDPNPIISVAMTDFRFSPADVRVAAGASVTIEGRNAGDVVHSWVLLDAGVQVDRMSQFDPATVLAELEAAEGDVSSITFTAPPPGEYQVICTITGHLSSGMEGTFIVEG
jgi:plastocyanin